MGQTNFMKTTQGIQMNKSDEEGSEDEVNQRVVGQRPMDESNESEIDGREDEQF